MGEPAAASDPSPAPQTEGCDRTAAGHHGPARAAFATALATALVLAPRLWEPLGRDQAVFALVGKLWWQGRWPYRDVFEHKPPGLLAVWALAAPLGDLGPGLIDLAAAALTAAIAVVLCWPLGRTAALFAGLGYAVIARHPAFGGFWGLGQPEPLQECALAVAAWLGVRRRWTACGVALGAALSLKYTLAGAVPIAFAAAWTERGAVVRVAAGLAAAISFGLALFAAAGALPALWQVAVAFNLRHAEVTSLPWAAVPAATAGLLSRLGLSFAGVPLLAVAAVRTRHRRAAVIAVLALLAALAQAIVQRKLWLWHPQAAVLPLVLLAALGLATLPERWRIALAAVALATALPGWGRYWSRHPWPARVAGDVSRIEWLATYTWGGGDWSAVEVAATAAWLRAEARPNDRLLVWGFEPGIYLHSGLPPATRWIYDYPVTVALPPPERAAAVAEIAASLPATRWWVVMRGDRNNLEAAPSDLQLRAIPALAAALDRDYEVAQEVGDALIYRRRE